MCDKSVEREERFSFSLLSSVPWQSLMLTASLAEDVQKSVQLTNSEGIRTLMLSRCSFSTVLNVCYWRATFFLTMVK